MPNPAFRRFVASSGLTNLADGIATLAWAWIASLITREPLLIAMLPVALRLPWVIFAIPAGIITDRVDRRRLIIAMDAVRAVAFLAAGVAVWWALPLPAAPGQGLSNAPLYGALLLAATIVGAAEVFRDNAAQTMLPAVVPHDQLEAANGRLWSVELTGNTLLGPALGALLLTYALPLPLVLNAGFYAVAIILVLGVAGQFRPMPRPDRDWRLEMKEGLRFLLAAPLMRSLAWITGFWNLIFQMVLIAMILHVQENLGLGARAYGLILAAGAVGGILAGWCGEFIVRAWGPKRTAQIMLAASAPAFLAIGLAPGAVWLGLTMAFLEFTGIVWNTVSVSYRQRTIPDALLGRVNSLYRLLAWGMMPVGLVLSGLIVEIAQGPLARETALTLPFFAAAAGTLALAIFGWRALERGFAR